MDYKSPVDFLVSLYNFVMFCLRNTHYTQGQMHGQKLGSTVEKRIHYIYIPLHVSPTNDNRFSKAFKLSGKLVTVTITLNVVVHCCAKYLARFFTRRSHRTVFVRHPA